MKERIERHRNGTIKAKGHMKAGELEGYWEWFRKDGTKMRSGYFGNGKQVGEWTTYDGKGKIVKVTKMKSPRWRVKSTAEAELYPVSIVKF